MCGIAGVVHRHAVEPVPLSVLLAMRDVLSHRGPDDAGHYLAPGVALGSRRLAILDLSTRGHMPMCTADGRYQIIHNGEVYNFQELRRALEAQGCRFQSHTDTEVLLQLFVRQGPAMLSKLNGMFAFAIWDAQEKRLLAARDRLGVKPLYYATRGDALYFASEEKALFAAGIPAEFDPATWEELLCFGYVAGERTPFVGVKRLLPGHFLLYQGGQAKIERWWNLGERAAKLGTEGLDAAQAWFEHTFTDAVALRRISDVPLGVLLSGGLDSSSVAATLARQANRGVASFTVRFAEQAYDEGPLARQVAERSGLEYHELLISNAELVSRLRRAAWMNDEPLAHASDIHISAISHYAKPRVTVLLSGEGSDEVMGGYLRYRPLRYLPWLMHLRAFSGLRRVSALPRRVRKLFRTLSLRSADQAVVYNSSNVLPVDLQEFGLSLSQHFPYRKRVLDEAKQLYPSEPMRQAMYLDQHTFLCSLLDRNDRMTMSASIECRVPFLDYRLVEGLARLPTSVVLGRQSKPLLRRAMGDQLPAAILRGRKWGFGVPWTKYLRQEKDLRELVEDLPNQPVFDGSPFERGKLKAATVQFLAGNDKNESLIYQLFMIALWHDAYFSEVRRLRELKPRAAPVSLTA